MAKMDDILEKYKKSPRKIFKVTFETRQEFTEKITAESREAAEEKLRGLNSSGTIKIRSIKEVN